MKTAKEILIAAADHIERNGKANGMYYDDWISVENNKRGRPMEQCPMCAVGAIGYQATGNPVHLSFLDVSKYDLLPWTAGIEALDALDAYLNEASGGEVEGISVYTWSDASPASEVVEALREAAARIE